MRHLPRLDNASGLSPLFAYSLRLRLGAYGHRYGAPMRLLAGVLDRLSRG